MKKTKKVLLAVLLVLSLMSNYAVNAQEIKEPNRYAISVIVQVVSYSGGGFFSSFGYHGHSFLIIHNESTIAVTIGHMSVAAGGYVTVGTFSNRNSHVGIWYNIEAYYINDVKAETYSSRIYELETLNEVATLNYTINSSDTWQITNNCSHFAANCWNAITPSSMHVSGGNPASLASSISALPGSQASITVSSKPITSIAYQTTYGITYDQSGAIANGSLSQDDTETNAIWSYSVAQGGSE